MWVCKGAFSAWPVLQETLFPTPSTWSVVFESCAWALLCLHIHTPYTHTFACGVCLFSILTYSMFLIPQLNGLLSTVVCFPYLSLDAHKEFIHPSFFFSKTINSIFSREQPLKPLVCCWCSWIAPPFQKTIFCLFVICRQLKSFYWKCSLLQGSFFAS